MTEPDRDYRAFASQVVFPRGPADLTSTTNCPACLTALGSLVCQFCGLDLTNPLAAELATVSAEAAARLDDRLAIIGQIRFDAASAPSHAAAARATTANAKAARARPLVATVPPVSVAPPVSAAPPANAAPPTTTAPQPIGAPQPGAPRRSTVQIILLIVGVSLLSVAAIFFLVYAFINYGITARGLIVAAVTVGAISAASALRRRALTATAEGIAVFAVVLVYLDAFAMRGANYFGLGAGDGAVFWGWVLIISAVGFVVWNRISGIRTPSVVGFSAFGPGVGLLVGGLNTQPDWVSRTYFAFAAVSLAAIVITAAQRSLITALAERTIVLVTSVLSLLAAAIAALFVQGGDLASTGAFLGLAAIALLQVFALRSRPNGPDDGIFGGAFGRVFGGVFAGSAAFLAATAVGTASIRSGDAVVGVIAPVTAAAIVAFGCELAGRRMPQAAIARHARVAALTAGGVAALIALFPFSVLLTALVTGVSGALTESWTFAATDALVGLSDIRAMAALAFALVGLIAAGAWTLGGALAKRRPLLLWFGGGVVILAVPLLSLVWLVAAGWLLVASGCLAVLLRTQLQKQRQLPQADRMPLLAVLAVSTTLGYLTAWASTGSWLLASIVVIALLLACRIISANSVVGAVLLGVACSVTIIVAAAGARQLALAGQPSPSVDLVNALHAISFASIALLALAALKSLPPVVTTLDRRTVFWLSGPVAAASAIAGHLQLGALSAQVRATLLLPEFATSLVLSLALLAAVGLWLTRSAEFIYPRQRIAASIALASVVLWAADSFARTLGLGEFGSTIAPMAAVVLTGAVSVTLTVLRPGPARWARELGIAIVAVPTLVTAIARADETTWLVLVLAAVATLLLAVSRDGLFSSLSPRRYLGWLALALATGGLWWRLGDSRVQELEPFVLPLSGVLLVIALLLDRVASRTADAAVSGVASPRGGVASPGSMAAPSRVAAPVALAGLLVAILPLGLEGAAGPLPRALVVAAVSAGLLVAGSSVAGSRRTQPLLDAAALAGAIGVLVLAIGRAVTLIGEPGRPDLRLDAWLLFAVMLLGAASFGQARTHGTDTLLRSRASVSLGLLAMTALLVFEPFGFSGGGVGAIRPFGLILVFCAVHVIALASGSTPLTRIIGWVSIAFAAISVVTGLLAGALDPPELGTIPVALALIATGLLTLNSVPTARTWAWLAPGVVVLLVPSLIATAVDAPLWRLVGLGVVAVAIVAISAIRRLQAPFLIAVAVTLIHAIASLAPQIRSVYQSVEWWVWLAIGGVVIMVVAAKFERSVRGFRSVAMRIRALR